MTIQSFWNGEPSRAVTSTAYLTGETAAELYGKMQAKAIQWWHSENPGTTMGKPVVLHWSFTKNAL